MVLKKIFFFSERKQYKARPDSKLTKQELKNLAVSNNNKSVDYSASSSDAGYLVTV